MSIMPTDLLQVNLPNGQPAPTGDTLPHWLAFVETLFVPDDQVCIRPIETWTTGDGSKGSRVLYKEIRCIRAKDLASSKMWRELLAVGSRYKANMFFGPCPRFIGRGEFDLAWQIRVVRVLWADLDNCTVQQAGSRIEAAGLPAPSIIVNSGHGVHLYWLLSEPYLIDDVGDPPGVFKDRSGKKPRHFIEAVNGEKLYEYLNEDRKRKNPEWPTLSEKAANMQRILAALANKIGGDHTQDLPRLLRLPGTLNRKNERNGASPVPCKLVECERERRYPLAEFTRRFSAAAIPRTATAEDDEEADLDALYGKSNQIKLTDDEVISRASGAKNGDKFNRLMAGNQSGYKSPSHAEQALCNLIAWQTDDKNQIERIFEQSGLVREKWRSRADYRDKTIGKALAARSKRFTQRCQGEYFTNYREAAGSDGETITFGLPLQTIRGDLLQRTQGWPKRVGDRLFVRGPEHSVLWLQTNEDAFSWLADQLQPTGSTENPANPIVWATGKDKVSRAELVANLKQTAENFRTVEAFPHFPPLDDTYYRHPKPAGGDGKALAELIGRFSPATPIDRALLVAFFLTLVWGGAPGKRPAWLFTTDDGETQKGRGAGKTTVAQKGAKLVGGLMYANAKEDFEKLHIRLLSPNGRAQRVVIVDNIKSLKFSWAELESLITTDNISGRQLYEGEGKRPNTLIWCLTVNGAALSKDMAQRTVVIKVNRPDYSATWDECTDKLIENRRWEIIGDLLAKLQMPGPELSKYSRWAAWEAAVLSRVSEPDECQRTIAERQQAVDEDQEEAEVVREQFAKELKCHKFDPDKAAIWISATEAARLVREATGEVLAKNRVGVYLGTLAIPELRKSDRGGCRGWAWRGLRADPEAKLTEFKVGISATEGDPAFFDHASGERR